MRYCEHCKVSVRGPGERCPLCQNPLSGTPVPSVFPVLSSGRSHMWALIRALLFLSFAAVVLSLTIDALLPGPQHLWPWYVAAAVGCMWICLGNLLFRRRNLPKNISWMVFWVAMLSLLWDLFTGWHGWSLSYVFPSLCVFSTLCVLVVPRIMGRPLGEYMIYVIIDALFGLIPLLFLQLRWVDVRYPSIISAAFSTLILGALATFRTGSIRDELKKRLHM